MDVSIGGLGAQYSSMIKDVIKDNVSSEAFKSKIERAAEKGEDAKLKQACNDFESYFIKMMFTSMRKTSFIPEDSMFGRSNAQNIFEDMLYEEYGKKIAAGNNGIGLSEMLYKQLSRKKAYDPEEIADELRNTENEGIDYKA